MTLNEHNQQSETIDAPKLNGLVLAGGVSKRMGTDKGRINWHGKEQRYYMADLLSNYCDEVFISCRDAEQQQEIDSAYKTLPDTFLNLGPFGAILSALRAQPDKAWLVIACDLPLLDAELLEHLIANRNTTTIATAYQSDYQNLPEPLITIYEPKSYLVLLQFLGKGYSCPRKVLINSDITLLQPPTQQAFTNVNTPEEFERVKAIINTKATISHAS